MHAISLRTLRPFVVLTVLLFPTGCGGEGDGGAGDPASGDGSEAGQAPPAADCPQRCADKAAACGAPSGVAAAQCQGICDGMLTEPELACLEDEDCAALEQALFGSGDVCGIGGGSASGGSSGSSSSGSPTGSTPPDADIGDPCECSGGSPNFESCSGTGSSCGSLTCYVFAGEGTCSQPCTADISGDDCPVGECVEHLISVEVSVGSWCEL